MKEFGSRLKHHRKRFYKASAELSAALGLHRNTIGRIERGDQWVSFDLLQKICRSLKITPSALLEDSTTVIEMSPKQALEVLAKFVSEQAVRTDRSRALEALEMLSESELEAVISQVKKSPAHGQTSAKLRDSSKKL